jgi:hypothetical protein
MNLEEQLLSLIFSISYGIIISYLFLLSKINNGIVHEYLLIISIITFLIFSEKYKEIRKYINLSRKVNVKFLKHNCKIK